MMQDCKIRVFTLLINWKNQKRHVFLSSLFLKTLQNETNRKIRFPTIFRSSWVFFKSPLSSLLFSRISAQLQVSSVRRISYSSVDDLAIENALQQNSPPVGNKGRKHNGSSTKQKKKTRPTSKEGIFNDRLLGFLETFIFNKKSWQHGPHLYWKPKGGKGFFSARKWIQKAGRQESQEKHPRPNSSVTISHPTRQSLALWRPCRCQKVAWRQRHRQSRPTLGSPKGAKNGHWFIRTNTCKRTTSLQ